MQDSDGRKRVDEIIKLLKKDIEQLDRRSEMIEELLRLMETGKHDDFARSVVKNRAR